MCIIGALRNLFWRLAGLGVLFAASAEVSPAIAQQVVFSMTSGSGAPGTSVPLTLSMAVTGGAQPEQDRVRMVVRRPAGNKDTESHQEHR